MVPCHVTAPVVDLSKDDVVLHPVSFFDPNGRLFFWNGELYRAVDPSREEVYRRLLGTGVLERLVQRRLLVDTELADFTYENRMVLKHRLLPFVSYPSEWCPEMLRDAALTALALERELQHEGLTLQDGHPHNVVFDGSWPVWVDVGSIVPRANGGGWSAAGEFIAYFLNPLRLQAAGQVRVAQWLLHDTTSGVTESEIEPFLGTSVGGHLEKRVGAIARAVRERLPDRVREPLRPVARKAREMRTRRPRSGDATTLIRTLEEEIRGLDLSTVPGPWSEYYESFPSLSSREKWDPKQVSVDTVLRDLRPRTVLDIGSNRGWYSLLAATKGSSVAAIDTDIHSLTELYRRARGESLPIQALLADFRALSLGYGPGIAVIASASDRLRADLVLALALTHHLVFQYRFDFDQVARALSTFTDKALLVEFVPAEDEHVSRWQPEMRPWYTREAFVAALRKRFASVEVMPSHPPPRVLLLCS
jgi:hypothetical protein